MRKIIDANCLQSPRLERYLSTCSSNMAVLTDYAAMEAYKGNTIKSILNSMRIVSEYPNQVIVLKGTQNVCGLKTKGKGLQKRLIDHKQTKVFVKYCHNLKWAEVSGGKVERALLDCGKVANEHMDIVLKDSERFIKAIAETAKNYNRDELQILRKKDALTNEMGKKIIEHIIEITVLLFSGHPKVTIIPDFDELQNSFIFRYSLCAYLLVLNWISEGGVVGVKPEKMRNDLVDMNYVAFATYFDGLITNDKKANQIYEESMVVLRKIFET